jgi:hypothetical protein
MRGNVVKRPDQRRDDPAVARGLGLSLLFVLALLILPGLVMAEPATFADGRVRLPVVEDQPYNLSMELQLVSGRSPLQFELKSAARTEAPLDAYSAFFDGNFLVIPDIRIGGLSYWADLEEIGPGRFVLDSYGRNQQASPPRTEPYQHQLWEWLPGTALDIGVGADGTAWAVGTDPYGFDYGLYRWDGHDWYESGGAAIRVDVDPLGRPWIINDYHEIWRQERSGGWVRLPGAAHDIGVGADGSVWVVGVKERGGGYEIYKLGSYGWIRVEGSGVRIDVDPEGRPWVINHDDQIYRLENGLWRRMPGKAKDIGVGADGSVWVIGVDERLGGYGIYRFNGTGWDKIPGSARQISVGPDGEPWVVNRDGDIFRSIGN